MSGAGRDEVDAVRGRDGGAGGDRGVRGLIDNADGERDRDGVRVCRVGADVLADARGSRWPSCWRSTRG